MEKYNNMDNELTNSNNIEIQKWVLKFDFKKGTGSVKNFRGGSSKNKGKPIVKTKT